MAVEEERLKIMEWLGRGRKRERGDFMFCKGLGRTRG